MSSGKVESLDLFESLGDNCEFGFVLRKLGNDTSSLLRWVFLDSVADTARGVRTGFRDAFVFENLKPAGTPQMVRDVTQGIAFHTRMHSVERDGRWEFVAPEDERRKIHEQEGRKFDYLRQKFEREITGDRRIYVVKRNEGLGEGDADLLLDAVRSRGGCRLLHVTLADSSHPAGTVERVSDRLAHGWIDRFAPYDHADDVSLAHWQSLLATTEAMFANKSALPAAPTAMTRAVDVEAGLAAVLAANGFFDAELYATRFAERFGSFDFGENPTVTHWLGAGRAARIVPTRMFDEDFYLAGNPDVAATGGFGFEHFLLSGHAEGRAPLSLDGPGRPGPPAPRELGAMLAAGGFFDAELYATRFAERFGSFDPGEGPTVAHWLGAGRAARIVPTGGFDEDFYLASNPDVAASGGFGFEHFLLSGNAEGRAPVPLDDPRHRHLFVPSFYADQAGISDIDPEALWQHYLVHGLPEDVSPSPLFDPAFYRARVESGGVEPLRPGEALVQHWLRAGADAGVVPTPLFHERFYRATHPDLAAMPFGFAHYVSGGLREGRLPCIWFDPYFYAKQPGVPPDAGYDHFLTRGLAGGLLPSRTVELLVQVDQRPLGADDFAALMDVSAGWDGEVARLAMPMFASLYAPAWHGPAETVMRGFIAHLRAGAMTAPGPLFDPAIYRERAAAAGIAVPSPDESAVLHWLRHGQAARIVPTLRFDEDDYHRIYPDIGPTVWGFEHFVLYGAAEGRSPRERIEIQRAPAWGKTTLQDLFESWHSSDFPGDVVGPPAGVPARYARRLEALLTSETLAQVFARTQRVDPDVGEIATISVILLPPYHDPLDRVHGEILRRLPARTYDTVVCVPWIRVGGADLVAGLLGRALLRIRPDERVLCLRTDNPHFERAHWLPDGVDVVDISDVVQSVSPAVAEHLLRLVLRGVSARRVFNVNSRLCWNMLRSYGANLALTLNTYSYMFCWDQTPSGLRVGYPAEFFAATAGTITAFLTDTTYLRDELGAMYRLPDAVRAKIVPLCTPAQTAVRPTAIARTVLERADPASRRLVLWAGRLDRQKRFDLVLDIARRMPEVEFRCWGAAMLDAPPDLATLPPNVTMQGSFDRFDELPLEQAGAWLFTALWEGMPTTLIELATRGVAVVASAVGGVPELIQADCGWLVPPGAGTDDYVKALRHALADPGEAASRAEALQRRVATRYNEQAYDAALDALLLAETRA